MYTVQWTKDGKRETRDFMLIMFAVEFVRCLPSAERRTAKVFDNNPKADLTSYVRELMKEKAK